MAKTSATTTSAPLVTASARHLHVGPRKMRLVTNAIKQRYVTEAVAQLNHMNKKAASMVVKLLNSAVANASHNFSLNPDWLFIKSITTDMGAVMKRYFPRARGSASTIRRKLCHVNVVLEERKRGKVPTSKLELFKKAKDKSAEQSLDQQAATAEKPKSEEPKRPQLFKTDEQRKMNTVSQKRRLFTRKTGE